MPAFESIMAVAQNMAVTAAALRTAVSAAPELYDLRGRKRGGIKRKLASHTPVPQRGRAAGRSTSCSRALAIAAGGVLGWAKVGSGATLPTTLPSETTAFDGDSSGYTGTIPTQFGVLTKVSGTRGI